MLIKSIGQIWLENPSFKARFYGFIGLREISKEGDSSIRLGILKKMSQAYFKSHSDFSWRTYESQRFQENCLVELFGLDLETGFIAAFEIFKELSETLTKTMQSKEAKFIKKLLGVRSLLQI